ncbi:MAG: hypothetical protein WBC70_09265 [Candidatus Aminicenantales bacterium]
MKKEAIDVGILLPLIFIVASQAQQSDFPVLKGPYLGQKPPGIRKAAMKIFTGWMPKSLRI